MSDDLVNELRNETVDWDGSRLPDEAESLTPITAGKLREVIAALERLPTATEEGARQVLAREMDSDKQIGAHTFASGTVTVVNTNTALRAMLAFARQSPTAPTEGVRDELPFPDKDGLVPIFRCDGTGAVIDVAHVPVWVRSALSRAGEKG